MAAVYGSVMGPVLEGPRGRPLSWLARLLPGLEPGRKAPNEAKCVLLLVDFYQGVNVNTFAFACGQTKPISRGRGWVSVKATVPAAEMVTSFAKLGWRRPDRGRVETDRPRSEPAK